MEKNLISTRWFPTCDFSARSDVLADNVFRDFDQQAEQLVGHDQSYLQLTPGAFRGRFLSAFFGEDVAIHMEHCNQALEQEVVGSTDHFTFGVTLSEGGNFLVNGRQISGAEVFVLPPTGNLHVISPLNGAIMAIAIKRDLFLRQLSLAPVVLDWLEGLKGTVGYLSARRVARRIREDAIAAIEGVAPNKTLAPAALVGTALAASIASKFSLELGNVMAEGSFVRSHAYDRYQQCRTWLHSSTNTLDDSAKISGAAHASKRSVEQAFSSNVSMGPLTYLRILRLHEIKRKLSERSCLDHSIGDIAAEHGFWDWSRFSQHYRRHFGELPSATRQNQTGNI